MGAGRGERVREVSCEELATHASRDNCWIGIAGRVYDVTKWIENHPGGQLPLLSLAGRDATDAFSSFHAGWVAQTRLAAFEVGIATPPLAKQRAAAAAAPSADEDFRALKKQLEREGLFAPTYRFYALEALRIASLFALVLACTASAHAPLRLAGAVALGIFWQQAAFVGHDAGHGGISGRRCVDSAVGLLCGNALTGIEIGWWQSTHNVHHLVPNSVEHDADVQHLPFMAVSEAFLGGIFSAYHNDVMPCPCGVLRLLSWQHLYFFPILTVARYGLLLQGVKTVGWEWGKRHTGFGAPHAPWTRALEAAALAVFYAYAAWLLTRLPNAAERLLFTYLSGATFAILHLQINLSHWSQRVLPGRPPGGWVDTQLAATLNWSCPPWLDWFHGGLQFQIEHHLFPRLPRANFRKVAPRVRALCAKHGIPYRQLGFFEATREVVGTLRTVAHAARRKLDKRA